ncbi:MAG TPA: hypothetical protein PKV48_00095 [Thermodesulfobacteriota bacterium]|nr:hypothetical protein [Thermodesulfobacteriota bacterium]
MNGCTLEAKGSEAISNIIELDVNSSVMFDGLDIQRVLWLGNSMCVYFDCPTDIAVLDEEETMDVPFDPLETPLRRIAVTELNNVQPPLTGDN